MHVGVHRSSELYACSLWPFFVRTLSQTIQAPGQWGRMVSLCCASILVHACVYLYINFCMDLFAHIHWLSFTHSNGAPGFRVYGGKFECQHEYNTICDALCRVCSSPCTRAISCVCVPCAGHLCGDCMTTPCATCHRRGIPKESRMTRICTLCYRVIGFWN